MQGRLVLDTHDQDRASASVWACSIRAANIRSATWRPATSIVCVTGVTDGPLVGGVSLGKTTIDTETIVYRSATGTIRRIRATHRAAGKFD